MIDKEKIEYVINGLLDDDFNYPVACRILDAFEKKATCMEDYDVLGAISVKAKHYQLQLRAAKYAYTHAETSEQLFKARENLFKIYNTLNEPEKALFYVELNLLMKPNDLELLLQKVGNLSLMNKKAEADQLLNSLTTTDKKQARIIEHVKFRQQLERGDTAKGIVNFLTYDKPRNKLLEDQLQLKFWAGGVYPGRTIVVCTEGGIGDELINIRFLDWFRERDMNPILYSGWNMYRPDLAKIYIRHGYEVYTVPYFLKKEYLWTDLMTLPGYQGLTESELWRSPYLTPLRQEKNCISDSNFKIGIKCNGNPYFDQDIYRRIPIDQMIAAMPEGASIYFFDKEHTDARCINLKDKLNTWDDTLDYIDQMDVIVSSCTSLVHAAGAMGKRTIVLTPIAEYMVWTSTRKDESTPWYGDNFKVIKQVKPREWGEPLSRVREILLEYMQHGQ